MTSYSKKCPGSRSKGAAANWLGHEYYTRDQNIRQEDLLRFLFVWVCMIIDMASCKTLGIVSYSNNEVLLPYPNSLFVLPPNYPTVFTKVFCSVTVIFGEKLTSSARSHVIFCGSLIPPSPLSFVLLALRSSQRYLCLSSKRLVRS